MQTIRHKLINWLKPYARLGLAEKFLLWLLIILGARTIMDPDFGWHLRSGTDLLKNLSVPKFDPYSYTLPNWPWVNHEWLSDGMVAFVYNHLGTFVLIGLFAIFIAAAFILAAGITKVEFKYKVLAGVIAVLAALPILGVRAQMITLFGMALTLWLLYRWRRGEIKTIWWFPLIFLAWANLHGGFVIGLIILALFFIVEGIKYLVDHLWPKISKKLKITEASLTKKQLISLFGMGIVSGLATLINPYGWGLYYDFYKLFINPFAISHISEWQPVSFDNPIAQNYIIYLIIFGLVLLLAYRKIEPTRWAITLVFLYLSLMYWRNLPFFMIMSVGFLAEILQDHTNLVFDQVTRNRWLMIIIVAIVSITTAQRLGDVVPKTLDLRQTFWSSGYPISAVEWMKDHPDELGDKMFNEYGWGGFLIWQFPDQKVFLDGRMPFWQIGDRFVFYDEQYIVNAYAGGIEIMETKYGVDWVFLRAGRPLDLVLNTREGWKKIYNDQLTVIYRKIEDVNEDKTNT